MVGYLFAHEYVHSWCGKYRRPADMITADFNQPAQSSSSLIAALHIRGPEKIIGTAVVLLLLIAIVMFAGMLRHVYGGASSPRR